jgi:hypothetical protein
VTCNRALAPDAFQAIDIGIQYKLDSAARQAVFAPRSTRERER